MRTILRAVARRAAALTALVVAVLLAAPLGAAQAAGDAAIDHAESSDGTLRLLVSVPGEAVDLDSVTVRIDGREVPARAASAATEDDIQRTTVLAIDTSNSMRGPRIEEARAAALAYLDSVPANVAVGIVTFDSEARVRQEPSRDRAASRAVLDDLNLNRQTALYQGVEQAIAATGDGGGQRQILLLSDGRDSTGASLEEAVSAIERSEVLLDVVSLEQGARAPAPLAAMARAGGGSVISADTDALAAAFTDEADALARQILVTATVPEQVGATDANVQVALEADGTAHRATAFLTVRPDAPVSPEIAPASAPAATGGGLEIPPAALYVALGAMGLGALVFLAVLLVPAKAKPADLTEHLSVYSASAEVSQARHAQRHGAPAGSLADQARAVAERALSNNRSFETRVAQSLESAGLALKASEWLLLHAAITLGAALLGILITAGNILGALLFGLIGGVLPWLFLAFKRSRRIKAFDANLADTLQLMSSSLSAGLSLAQSMDTIVREGMEPITSEFKRAIVESRLGVPLEDALDGVADRMQSKDFRWVVMAIRIQREVGGNLAELLNTVAATLREREYLRRHVSALSAEGRLSCWILGALPPVFFGYLVLTKPDYVSPMYTEPIGWILLVATVILLSVGIFWMSKVAKVEV